MAEGNRQPLLQRIGWPIFALLGLLATTLPMMGYGWAWALWAVALALVFASAFASSAHARTRSLAIVALVALGAGAVLGGASLWLTEQRGDPLAPWLGAQVTLQGEWDGQFLTLTDPPARVVLAPKPDKRRGWLEVSGTLLPPRTRSVPAGFDQAAWLSTFGGPFSQAPTAVLAGAEPQNWQPPTNLKGRVQAWFAGGWTQLTPEAAALMRGIELGDRSDLGNLEFAPNYTVRDAFARAGLAHLLALSGQHVSLLVGALALLLTQLFSRKVVWTLTGLFLLAYLALLVNVSPSVSRAVVMGAAAAFALAWGRGKLDAPSVLALAACACLLLFPRWVLAAGFQLSFLAVGGLLLLPRVFSRLPDRFTHGPAPIKWLTATVAVTLLAQAATLPLVAGTFGMVPLAGVPANLLATPLMLALVPLGFVAGLLGPLDAWLAVIINPLAHALLAVAEWFGRWPVLPWGAVSGAGYLAYALAAAAAIAWLRGRLAVQLLLATWLACGLLTALPNWVRPPQRLVFLDVGQGDATLIQTPHLRALIDGGGTPHGDFDLSRVTVPAMHALGVHALDVVVATHSDADHIEGLIGVLQQMPVGELWVGVPSSDNPLMQSLLATANARGVRVREVRRGDYIAVGQAITAAQPEANGLRLEVLWPTSKFASSEPNENSVALRLTAWDGDRTFKAALLGDLPAPLEHSLGLGRVDVLKTPHHGSRHSTSETLLLETQPADAVISSGFNTFGHPHPEVLERLEAASARIWRTDQQGSIIWPLP